MKRLIDANRLKGIFYRHNYEDPSIRFRELERVIDKSPTESMWLPFGGDRMPVDGQHIITAYRGGLVTAEYYHENEDYMGMVAYWQPFPDAPEECMK